MRIINFIGKNPIVCINFQVIFQPTQILFRLTFKIGDVFAVRISETEGFAGLQKCGGAKYRRGQSPNGVLWNPKMPNRHFCANRVLDAGLLFPDSYYTIIYYFLMEFSINYNNYTNNKQSSENSLIMFRDYLWYEYVKTTFLIICVFIGNNSHWAFPFEDKKNNTL